MRLSNRDIDKLSKSLERAAGQEARVEYTDYEHLGDPNRTMGIQEAESCPEPGYTTWCTVGLAQKDWRSSNFPHRLELVLAAAQPAPDLGPVLVTLAFFMIDHDNFVGPGTVIRDAVKHAGVGKLAARMPHATFVLPFCWGKRFQSVALSTREVWLLQAVPITKAEAAYLESKGFDTFEEILAAKEVDLLDLGRPSAV